MMGWHEMVLAVILVWVGLLLIHTIIRSQLRAQGHTYARERPPDRHRATVPDPVDDDCVAVGCDRYGYWLWTSADLNVRLKMCHQCASESQGLRGGFIEMKGVRG